MNRYLVEALETERFGRGGAHLSQFLDDRLILQSPHELVFNHDIRTSSSSHVTVGRIRFGKSPYLL